ncbi:hypothetical protein [Streptomyces niveus]|uniref:hypothetical protein n=1 Tax=Streptomyces niveus TaxID=193462 RepID=UPI0003C58374|nr:hypothetical protein [Streptomyces niveus]EST27826.1 hypothetical protein M877_15915 [Streptomyces niveus NCIMB 11891]
MCWSARTPELGLYDRNARPRRPACFVSVPDLASVLSTRRELSDGLTVPDTPEQRAWTPRLLNRTA